MTHDSKSKGAKSDTHHTNLFITYYYDVLGPIFVCGLKAEGLKRVLKKEIRRKHANIREHEVKVTVQI